MKVSFRKSWEKRNQKHWFFFHSRKKSSSKWPSLESSSLSKTSSSLYMYNPFHWRQHSKLPSPSLSWGLITGRRETSGWNQRPAFQIKGKSRSSTIIVCHDEDKSDVGPCKPFVGHCHVVQVAFFCFEMIFLASKVAYYTRICIGMILMQLLRRIRKGRLAFPLAIQEVYWTEIRNPE